MADRREGALTGYRVLDLTDHKGAYGTKLLADLGAEVIKIEPPGGDPTRRMPPFAHDDPHPEKSLPFVFRNAGKRGITLNLETPTGRTLFKRLVEKADVLVESFPPGYLPGRGLGFDDLKEIQPGLIMASITEFGQSGPHRDWKGSAMVDFALSGVMIESGFPEKAPCNLPDMPAYDATAVMAALSIVLCLYDRGITGEGRFIDVSVRENARLAIYPWAVTIQSYAAQPGGPPPPPESRMGPAVFPVYPCRDGFVRIVAITPGQWDGFLKALGNPETLTKPEWRDYLYRIMHARELYDNVIGFTLRFTMEELFSAGHRFGVPIAPVYDVAGFVNSPQTKARQFFVPMNHPFIGEFTYPGPPYKWSEAPAAVRASAPLLGQDNRAIYGDELGLSPEEIGALRSAGVI